MTDEKARDAAFEEVKRTTNMLGAWDISRNCMFDHKKMWEIGYDLGFAAGAEAERERIAVKLQYIAESANWEVALPKFIDELEGKQDGK